MKPIPAEKNTLYATKALLDFCKVPVTKYGLKDAFEQHPDFPSLNSLSDVLNEMKVPNLATRLTPDSLSKIPLPAIAYLNTEGGIFAPITKVGETIEWLHTKRGWQKDSFGDFIQKWSGVTLLVEPNKSSGEQSYVQNRRRESLALLRVLYIVSSFVLIIGILYSNSLGNSNWRSHSLYNLIGLLKAAGTFVCGLLVWYSIDSQNSFLQKFCHLNSYTNCDNILASSAARVTNWLSWAEIGLFYFAGGLLTWVVGVLSSDNIPHYYLYLFSIMVLPYTLWSIYYQAFVAREWCTLCLTVQLILWLEFLIGYKIHGVPSFFQTEASSISSLSIVVVCFLVTPLLWSCIKPSLQKAVRYYPLLREFQKLKFDHIYLSALRTKKRVLPPIFNNMKVISAGNPQAENKLIMVISPTCTACRRNHQTLLRTLESYHNLHVQFILAVSHNTEDVASRVAQSIFSLPTEQMLSALNSWFAIENSRFEKWSYSKYVNAESKEASQQIMLHLRWLELAGVTQAPTSFLNDIELPKFYLSNELPRLCNSITNKGIGQFI